MASKEMEILFVFIIDSIKRMMAIKAKGLKNIGLIAMASTAKNKLKSKNRLGIV